MAYTLSAITPSAHTKDAKRARDTFPASRRLDDERRIDDFQILLRVILLIRRFANSGDHSQCFIEADHVRNIPELLINPIPYKEKYYFEVERVSYLRDARPESAEAYAPFWEKLAEKSG